MSRNKREVGMWAKILYLASTAFFVAPSLPLIAAPPASINNSTSVTVEGYGTDVQSAIDNATQNALLNAAGAYISSDTTLETRTKITDGIKSYSKSFNERTSQTSNGVIQDVVVQNVANLGGQFKAVVQVTVRTGELRTYVLELSQGKNTVSEGLFSQVRANLDIRQNMVQSAEDIFAPILDGRAIKFQISKPIPFSNLPENYNSSDHRIVKTRNSENSQFVFIRVIQYIDVGYLNKIRDYLNYISLEKYPSFKEINCRNDNSCGSPGRHESIYGLDREKADSGKSLFIFPNIRTDYIPNYDWWERSPIYVIPISNDEFLLSQYCSKVNFKYFTPKLKPRSITLKFTDDYGFLSVRSLKYKKNEYREDYELIYDKNGTEFDYSKLYGDGNEFYIIGSAITGGDTGWNMVGCDFRRPILYNYRVIDFVVKMTEEELKKSTNISVNLE